MKTIFMNTENSKTNESNKVIYQFTDKLNLKNPNNKNIRLVNLIIYYTWKNIISAYNNNKFKISVPTWNDGFYLFSFVPNKQFDQLINISPRLLTMLKTTNAEFQSIQAWFTDQNNRPLEIEDSVNITLLIG